jgi:hypothetical protein
MASIEDLRVGQRVSVTVTGMVTDRDRGVSFLLGLGGDTSRFVRLFDSQHPEIEVLVPDEPTGYGAVAEVGGYLYIKIGDSPRSWRGPGISCQWFRWSDLCEHGTPNVLSEGVAWPEGTTP